MELIGLMRINFINSSTFINFHFNLPGKLPIIAAWD